MLTIFIFIASLFFFIILAFILSLKIVIACLLSVIYWNIIIFLEIIITIIIYIINITDFIITWIIFNVFIYMRAFFLYIIRLSQRIIYLIRFLFAWLDNIISVYRCIVLRSFFFYIPLLIIFIFLFRCNMNLIWTYVVTIVWTSNNLERRSIILFWICQCYVSY